MTDTPKLHAVLAPSSADRWMTCLGSVALTKGLPDHDSPYAVEGVDLHELAALCLETKTQASDYVGRPMLSGALVNETDAQYLQDGYLDPILAYEALGTLLIEETVPLVWYTGNPQDTGTSDADVLGVGRELIVADLKFGRGVEVSPENNRQCQIYAISLIEKHDLWDEYDTVRIVICQPRTGDGKPKEWVTPIADLKAFKLAVERKAELITLAARDKKELPLVPSEKACRFCKAKATCPALRTFATEATAQGMEDLTAEPIAGGDRLTRAEILGMAMDKVDLVEIWMKGVQSAVEIDLLEGKSVVGKDGPYKLVMGKKGNRKWSDEKEVTDLFRNQFRMSIEETYDLSLISPTTAEKRLKKAHPTQWKRVSPLITQSEGSKHVANALDNRPAIEPIVPGAGMEIVTEATALQEIAAQKLLYVNQEDPVDASEFL